jgi:hypothetical protein
VTLRQALHSRRAAWAVALVAGLIYPLVALANGGPRFPSVEDCVHPAVPGSEVMVVYGYFDSQSKAIEFRNLLRSQGYEHAEVESDGGCGRVRIAVRGYPNIAAAEDAVAEAARIRLAPTLEQASP